MQDQNSEPMVLKLISGGQTGVDRAALDVAIELKIRHGGWCPAGRRAEDGIIPRIYQLQETDSRNYAVRTRLNVRDSQGTLILCEGLPTGGTKLTVQFAQQMRKPLLILPLSQDCHGPEVEEWLREHTISVLNVAGPRETTAPGAYARTRTILVRLLADFALTDLAKSCNEHRHDKNT